MTTSLSFLSLSGLTKRICFVVSLFCLSTTYSGATHLLGGDITWKCNGSGEYVFQLRIFRDCSGPAISVAGQSLRVWNHPTLTQIPLNFISQSDISPNCTPVAGGPQQIDCASGNPNAVEEYIFQSAPTVVSGVPPAQGFAFTWDAFSRPPCDNLLAASTYGLTLRSFMFNNGGLNTSPCFDSSPQFDASPVYTICSGQPFVFAQNASDPDLDSLVFSFGNPIDQISTGIFNPPAFPVAVPYMAGYAQNNPLPDASFNAGNVPASIDAQNGNIDFTSFTTGKFIVVVKVESFRGGIKIAEVYREVLLVILPCGANNAPVVTPPFSAGTSWSATYIAGEAITFNLASTDLDLLQNGAAQSNILTASSLQFGTNFTNAASGCLNAPCATLNNSLPQVGMQGVSTIFNWQTDCDHIAPGAAQATYNFEFLFSDDFCSIPGVTAGTVTINLLPPPPVNAPQIKCADVAVNGDVTLSWIQPADPYNSFVHYEVYNGGTLIATITNINQTSFLHVGADAHLGSQPYHIITISGCNSSNQEFSDTLNTMFLTVNNPGNGTAQLTWNALINPNIVSSTGYYRIYSEYPAGTWNLIDSVAYGTTFYYDTITVCNDSINYKIEIGDLSGCISTSSIDGKTFQDVLAPYLTEIINVTVDTASGLAQLNWLPNPAGDTEGYIILNFQPGSGWVIIDTVWGINNTTYDYLFSSPGTHSEGFGIATFDSCWSGNPLTPNTSAMGVDHFSIYLTNVPDICARTVSLSWNAYTDWSNGVQNYEVYASENNGPYLLLATTAGTNYVHANVNRLSNYCYLVVATENVTGVKSLSNKSCRFISSPPQPAWSYLQTATVENGEIEIRCFADLAAYIQHYRIERTDNLADPFTGIGTVVPVANPLTYIDTDADPSLGSYYYRAIAVDSCGDDGIISNNGRTIFLTIDPNNLALINTLQWNHYGDWDGTIVQYRIYRSINGIMDSAPIASVPGTQRYYEDYVGDLLTATGEFCYYVEAVESLNSFGISEISHSNVACATMTPLLWVPNAFTVGGVNPVFKPVAGYVDFNHYSFKIFNRWGEIVFHTDDIGEGWNGIYKGDQAEQGVYVWMIEFTDGSGQAFDRKGYVTLLIIPK